MKKTMILTLTAAALMALTACSKDSALDDSGNGSSNNNDETATGTTTSAYAEMTAFTVAIDQSTAEPTEAATPSYPEASDAFSENTFATVVNINMSSPEAKTENGVTITVSGNDVTASHGSTEGVCYVVTGSTDNGSLTIDGKTDYELNLNGASITNTRSTAIDLQSKQKAFVVLTGSNKVTDGTSADDSHKGAIFGKGKLLFSGTGSLEVLGTYNNGIHGKSNVVFDKGVNVYVKSTANHGIKAGDNLIINGGIINVEVSANGGKGINGDVDVIINGGRTTIVATGNGTWEADETLSYGGDTKAAAGVGCDGIFYMNGGELYARATGSGGKGIKADLEAYITGGKIRIITEGGLYYSNGQTESHNYTGNTDNLPNAYTSSPKGMKIGTKEEVDGVTTTYGLLQISGGDIMVRTSGNNAEGIESKGTFDVSGGTILVYAHDDALNSTGDMSFTGGTIVAVGTNNDAIDSNGNMTIAGGTIIACGGSGAETGIDIDESHMLYIKGGYLFSIGGRIDGRLGSTTQGIVSTTGSITANGTVSISNGSKTLYTFNMPPVSYNNGTVLLTTPDLTSGSSYTLTMGSGTQTVTASNTISNQGGPGDGPGGGGKPW